WSLACVSHSLAAGFGMLAISRFLLGAGEGGGFPAATKVIAEWFSAAERSTAMGIVNAGTALGAMVAPPAIAAILLHGSWRWVFVFVTRAPGDWALAIFSLAFFGQQSWSTLVMIVPTDLFERRVVASVAGLVGFGGAMGGLLMNLAAGRLLDAGFGYGTVFNIVGTLHVAAFGVILVAIPRIHPLETS